MPKKKDWEAQTHIPARFANHCFRALRLVYTSAMGLLDLLLLRFHPSPLVEWGIIAAGAALSVSLLCQSWLSWESWQTILALLSTAATMTVLLGADTAQDPPGLAPCGKVHSINIGSGIFNEATGKQTKKQTGGAVVTRLGVVGDTQEKNYIEHWGGHGGVEKAVMLWSAEIQEKLRGEGHSITAGACGEQITLEGVEWGLMRTGAKPM